MGTNGPIRCPGCFGKGRVSSAQNALRSAFGKIREEEMEPKLFAQVKAVYLALSKHPDPNNGHSKSSAVEGKGGRSPGAESHGPTQPVVSPSETGVPRRSAPATSPPKAEDQPKPKRPKTLTDFVVKTEHALGRTEHIGPRRWQAICRCAFPSDERGTRTAAIHEIERHVKESA